MLTRNILEQLQMSELHNFWLSSNFTTNLVLITGK